MPQELLPKQTRKNALESSHLDEIATRWLDCIENLSWNRLKLCPRDMQSVLVH